MRPKPLHAFTIVELLIVIGIIGLLSAIGFAALRQAQRNARSERRLNDLKTVAKALELYFNDHNSYPKTLGGAPSTYTFFDCYDVPRYDSYIPGLAPKYISALPHDPLGKCTGNHDYNYAFTSDGRDYKFFAPMVPNNAGSLENCNYGKKYGVEDPVRCCWCQDEAWSVYTPGAKLW